MFGAGNLCGLPDLSKPLLSQAKRMVIIVNRLKRDKTVKTNVLGHLCLYTTGECSDYKIALCVQGGGQAEDVPLFHASVSPSVHFTFLWSCVLAPCNGSIHCSPP